MGSGATTPEKALARKSKIIKKSAPEVNSFRRRKFRPCDCPLGTQSHANPITLLGPRKVSTFCHRIASHSPFWLDGTANGNRTDRKTRKAYFGANSLLCSDDSGTPSFLDRRAFVGTNPENAANFCIARRSRGISAIVNGRLPRRGLLASVKVRDQVSHPLRRDSGRSSNRNRHLSPSVNTSRLLVTNPVNFLGARFWIASDYNSRRFDHNLRPDFSEAVLSPRQAHPREAHQADRGECEH